MFFLFLVMLLLPPKASDFCTTKAWEFSKHSFIDGISLRQPLDLCWPKNTSSGSWLKRFVRINFIPSSLSRNLMSSFSECTKRMQNSISIYASELYYHKFLALQQFGLGANNISCTFQGYPYYFLPIFASCVNISTVSLPTTAYEAQSSL